MKERNAGERLSRRGGSIKTIAATSAAVPILLVLFALSDAPPDSLPGIRVHTFAGDESDRASLGQLHATDTTPPPTTPSTSNAPSRLSVRVQPTSQSIPPSTAPPVAAPPTTLPPFALRLAGAFTIDGDVRPKRQYPAGSDQAPRLTWSVEDAVSVTVTGPGVYSTEKSASIVPCPGVFDTEKQRCHPERGEHVYTLTATDEYGRSVTEQVTLSIGVNDDAGNPETPADPDTGASPPNPPSAPTTTTPPNEKPDKPEKPEKPDKPEKPEKPERPERKRKPDEG